MKTDVVIAGCGVAGLFTALSLPQDTQIVMLSKSKKENSNSYLAQGGLSTLRNKLDFETYFQDTMKAGHFENLEDAVKLMIEKSSEIVDNLLDFSVEFNKKNDEFLYTCEGAHSIPRILFHNDITGQEITSKLLLEAEKSDNIKIYEHCTMIDILEQDCECFGVLVQDKSGEIFEIFANYTVLATGGVGGLYEHSTNFEEMTGDSLAIAIKHNISLKDTSYVQTHPTTFYSKNKGRRFLITESVRGEGGILYNKNMQRFTDELLARDVLTQEIYKQMEKDKEEFVLLSFEKIPCEKIYEHFPNIYKKMLEEGFDITKEPIPIVPAQHYYMGGIEVDLNSKTSMERLYAVGETSCNGVHGANRLASNSLLESMVFGKQVALDIKNNYKTFNFAFKKQSYETVVSKEVVLREIEKKKRKKSII